MLDSNLFWQRFLAKSNSTSVSATFSSGFLLIVPTFRAISRKRKSTLHWAIVFAFASHRWRRKRRRKIKIVCHFQRNAARRGKLGKYFRNFNQGKIKGLENELMQVSKRASKFWHLEQHLTKYFTISMPEKVSRSTNCMQFGNVDPWISRLWNFEMSGWEVVIIGWDQTTVEKRVPIRCVKDWKKERKKKRKKERRKER